MASWETDQPLASRRAPRLFLATGKPTLTSAEKALLRQAEKMTRSLDISHGLLLDGIRADDPAKCATAVKALLGVALFLDDFANKATREAV